VEARKYFVEPHIPGFAQFDRWAGKKVLEIGCGIGTDTMGFARAGAQVTAVDLSDASLAVAKAAAEFIGTPAEEMIGRTDYDFLPREAADGIFRTDSEAVRTGRTLSLNNLHPFRPGPRYMNVIKTPLKNSAGEIIGLRNAFNVLIRNKVLPEECTLRAGLQKIINEQGFEKKR